MKGLAMRSIATGFPQKSAMFAVLAALLLLGACQEDTSTYRRDPYGSTPAEGNSPEILPNSLMEFSDQFPQRLVQRLAAIPEIANSSKPVTVIMGDLNNKTQIVSSNDFEMVQHRIRANLVNSDFVSKHMIFVENRARMGALAGREGVGTPGTSGPPPYDPETTFTLNGDFYRIARGDTSLYYMEYTLVNFKSNRLVFSDQYPSKQSLP
jgi:hypothetical protein